MKLLLATGSLKKSQVGISSLLLVKPRGCSVAETDGSSSRSPSKQPGNVKLDVPQLLITTWPDVTIPVAENETRDITFSLSAPLQHEVTLAVDLYELWTEHSPQFPSLSHVTRTRFAVAPLSDHWIQLHLLQQSVFLFKVQPHPGNQVAISYL